MVTRKTAIQKTYEITAGPGFINVEFLGANRQSDCLEIPLVFDKSDKCTTLYDSYNVDLASKYIKLVKLSNFTNISSLTNEKNMTRTTWHKSNCGTNTLSPGVAMDTVPLL